MYMPVLIFFAVLDLERKSSFMDRHLLRTTLQGTFFCNQLPIWWLARSSLAHYSLLRRSAHLQPPRLVKYAG